MWLLNNDTPFLAQASLACDKVGADLWLVAIKATFQINEDGTTDIAPEQVPIMQVPLYRGDPARSSLIYETDLDYTKPGTDVLLHGHAYASGGRPARQIDVSLSVAGRRKILRVFGDRACDVSSQVMRLGSPESFTEMPIIYERAFGGIDERSIDKGEPAWDPRNPAGVGFSAWNQAPDRLPNIESIGSRTEPGGFGPVARHWAPRVSFAGTYDEEWEEERFPLLPLDFDERFFHCAPPDQQFTKYLVGHEEVELLNLTPGGVLKFRLPRIAFGLTTRIGSEIVRYRPALHTVIIESDAPRIIMVWHASLPCQGRKYEIKYTDVIHKKFI